MNAIDENSKFAIFVQLQESCINICKVLCSGCEIAYNFEVAIPLPLLHRIGATACAAGGGRRRAVAGAAGAAATATTRV